MRWTVTFYSERVEDEILALPVDSSLRIKAAEGIATVFYCTIVNRRIMFLHQFVKKTEKTPARELQIARSRMKEMKDE